MAREINHHNVKGFGAEWDGRMGYLMIALIGREDDGPEIFNCIEA